jgi:hypothetical protein
MDPRKHVKDNVEIDIEKNNVNITFSCWLPFLFFPFFVFAFFPFFVFFFKHHHVSPPRIVGYSVA